jgi:hypothetical protein
MQVLIKTHRSILSVFQSSGIEGNDGGFHDSGEWRLF